MKWEIKKIILTLLSWRYVYDIHVEMSNREEEEDICTWIIGER